MSASSAAVSAPKLKSPSLDRPTSAGNTGPQAAAPKPKRTRRFLLLGVIGGALLVGGAVWYFLNAGFETTDDATIEAHVIEVSPKVSAHVKAVHFDDNYEVKRGDLLVELDPRDFDVNLASAQANLASAESKLTQAEAQQNVAQAGIGQTKADLASSQATSDNAQADLKRNEQLYQTHVIDRREYDASVAQAKSDFANVESNTKKVASQEAQVQLAAAQYSAASAEEKQAEAQLRQAQLQLSYTQIYAPFDGRVTKKSVEPGNYVQPGQTLFSLVPPEVWVIANFKETQLKNMRVGQPVSVQVDAVPGNDFKAHVDSFQVGTGGRFTLLPPENATGNFVKVVQRVPVKIVFDEPASKLERLWAGESVEPKVNVGASAAHSDRAQPLPPAILGKSEQSEVRGDWYASLPTVHH
ncbi:MAG: HlyD family secretion protein [Verrucomicrobia bacterium]|nr:HlyD family secretion protein [Verrucomicrobiota bacterium]